MPSPVALLLLAAILPLASFGVVLGLGRRMQMPVAGWASSAFSLISFACTLAVLASWFNDPHGVERWGYRLHPIFRTFAWRAGSGWGAGGGRAAGLSLYVDSLTLCMFAAFTFVFAAVHLFSVGWLRRADHFVAALAALDLLCFTALATVLSGSLPQMSAFLILCSAVSLFYLHIMSPRAHPKFVVGAFSAQRLGDAALLIGAVVLTARLGAQHLPDLDVLNYRAGIDGDSVVRGGKAFSGASVTAAGICLILGAAAHCAAFPFQNWLVRSRPTSLPGGAVVCSATMTLGVYLLARAFPMLTPTARLLLAMLGAATALMAALIALAQTRVDRVLSWLAVSQVGFMLLALGVGSWIGGLFHLITHAFLFALMFLSAAVLAPPSEDRRSAGSIAGPLSSHPETAALFLLGAVALAGTPFLSASYSRSLILSNAAAFSFLAQGDGRSSAFLALYALPAIASLAIALAIGRCAMTMFSRPSSESTSGSGAERMSQWLPTLVLAVPVVICGYAMNVPELLGAAIHESQVIAVERAAERGPKAEPGRSLFDQAWPSEGGSRPITTAADPEAPPPAHSPARQALADGAAMHRRWTAWTWLAGLGASVVWSLWLEPRARFLPRVAPIRWGWDWLRREMYFDELYTWTIARAASFAFFIISWFDRRVLEPLLSRIDRPSK